MVKSGDCRMLKARLMHRIPVVTETLLASSHNLYHSLPRPPLSSRLASVAMSIIGSVFLQHNIRPKIKKKAALKARVLTLHLSAISQGGQRQPRAIKSGKETHQARCRFWHLEKDDIGDCMSTASVNFW